MGISESFFGYGVSWSDWWSDSDEWDGYLAIICWIGLLEIYFYDYCILIGIAGSVLMGREIMSFTQVFIKNVEKNRLPNSMFLWIVFLYFASIIFLLPPFFFGRLIKGSRFIPKNLASSFRKLKQR
jgi:hypothetical protein